ncbi:MAG: hypothetical protein DLM54_05370 [Acidimicrobiales bacterium]|nr:MAG: hypothetical protein DLM54_05370 [Acidimicrobiales bacterium]
MLDALVDLPIRRVVVVVGHRADQVVKALQATGPAGVALDFAEQAIQRGTGDAVAVGLAGFPDDDEADEADVVVLPGDTPLLRPATLAGLVRVHQGCDAAATLLSARLQNPSGYGRVVRNRDGQVARVVEEGDANDQERTIDEVNTSVYCFRHSVLVPALRRLSPQNVQGEYYLTDAIGVIHDAGYRVVSVAADDPAETVGINDRAQLGSAEAVLRRRINQGWMRRGVTMLDPAHTYVDTAVRLAPDVTLLPGTFLQGNTTVGRGAEIGPQTRLVDCSVGEGASVEASVGRQAQIGDQARVGPFAFLPPGTRVAVAGQTGPFLAGGLAGDEDGGDAGDGGDGGG